MRLSTDDPTRVSAPGTGWWATWRPARPIGHAPVMVLDLAKTALATLTHADVAYYQRTGRWPPLDRLALDPAWEYPTPGEDGTADRREFHRWRSGGPGTRAGRPSVYAYDTVVACRRIRSHAAAVAQGYHDARGHLIKYLTFHRMAVGETYWWVQAGDPSWMGWTWTHEGGPSSVLDTQRRLPGDRQQPDLRGPGLSIGIP